MNSKLFMYIFTIAALNIIEKINFCEYLQS